MDDYFLCWSLWRMTIIFEFMACGDIHYVWNVQCQFFYLVWIRGINLLIYLYMGYGFYFQQTSRVSDALKTLRHFLHACLMCKGPGFLTPSAWPYVFSPSIMTDIAMRHFSCSNLTLLPSSIFFWYPYWAWVFIALCVGLCWVALKMQIWPNCMSDLLSQYGSLED